MEQREIKARAESFIAALHDIESDKPSGIEQILTLFAANAELSNPAIEREGNSRVGHAQIADFWKNYRTSFQNIHSEFFEVTASENAVGLFWRSTGAHVTGDPVSYEGVSLLDFDDAGKIVRFKGFYDSNQVSTKVAA